MKNRVRQSRTLGSVRGEDGVAMVNLPGHAAGNGGHGQGEPTAATGPLLLGGRGPSFGPGPPLAPSPWSGSSGARGTRRRPRTPCTKDDPRTKGRTKNQRPSAQDDALPRSELL